MVRGDSEFKRDESGFWVASIAQGDGTRIRYVLPAPASADEEDAREAFERLLARHEGQVSGHGR